jgi:hypothetical protein
MKENKAVTKYWLEHYVQNGLCSLCANVGLVDTRYAPRSRSVRPPAWTGRVNFCICPNGQALRAGATAATNKKA